MMSPAAPSGVVLLIDDQPADRQGLIDLVRERGYDVEVAPTEHDAMKVLAAVAAGEQGFALAIVDVMIAPYTVSWLLRNPEEMARINAGNGPDGKRSGIRIVEHVRDTLRLDAATLPLICFTVSRDRAVDDAMERLRVPLFRADHIRGEEPDPGPSQTLRETIEALLPRRP